VVQTINLAAICTPADYNTRPLDTIYSNFIDALPVVMFALVLLLSLKLIKIRSLFILLKLMCGLMLIEFYFWNYIR
jgi:uncharacterized membrane protein YfhO